MRIRLSSLVLGAGLAALGSPAYVAAQTVVGYAVGAKEAVPSDLEAQAAQLYSQPKQYDRAADLHMQAAELRAPEDPMRVKDLTMAARLYYYDGQTSKARTNMERAAEEALAAGDLITAGHTFVDAAVLASADKDPVEARRLVDKARLLMNSPLIAAKDRQGVLGRIGSPS